jgi:predicted transcriptional regulator
MPEVLTRHTRPVYATDDDAHLYDKRRVHPDKRGWCDLAVLQTQHRRIIELHVQGLTESAIARTLDLSAQAVQRCICSNLGRLAIREMNAKRENRAIAAADKIAEMAEKALDVVCRIMEGSMEVEVTDDNGNVVPKKVSIPAHTMLKAAETVLDRNVFTPRVAPRKSFDDDSSNASAEVMEMIKQRFHQSQKEVVDITARSASLQPIAVGTP